VPTRLRIRAVDHSVELAGDAEFVAEAWAGLRPALLRRIAQGFERERAEPRRTPRIAVPEDGGRHHVTWTETHDLYRRVYAPERAGVAASPLFRHVDLSRVRAVYVERVARDVVHGAVDPGRALWSETTARVTAAADR